MLNESTMKNGLAMLKGATPKGTSMFAQVVEPSYKFDDDGVYQMILIMDKREKDVAQLIQQIETFEEKAREMAEEFVAQSKNMRRRALPPYKDENHGDWFSQNDDSSSTNFYFIRAKAKARGVSKTGKAWSFAPKIFDAFGKPITDINFRIGNGSVCKMAVQINPYATAVGYGLTIRLDAVQVIDLIPYDEKTAKGYGFEEEAQGFDSIAVVGAFDKTELRPTSYRSEYKGTTATDADEGDF